MSLLARVTTFAHARPEHRLTGQTRRAARDARRRARIEQVRARLAKRSA